jgi:tRNA-guanine family transglycosylase
LLAGFSAGETSAQRNSVVQSTLVQLPSQLPRMLECVSTVLDVLDAVSLGIDLISWSYPDTLTDACCAATFPLDARNGGGATTKICLRDASYARDVTPLVEGCRCYACQHHTKAYIHHLVVRGCAGCGVVCGGCVVAH